MCLKICYECYILSITQQICVVDFLFKVHKIAYGQEVMEMKTYSISMRDKNGKDCIGNVEATSAKNAHIVAESKYPNHTILLVNV
jgi:hypothetical protein